MLTTLDLFAGIGGFALGFEETGLFKTTCFVENEPYCQAVLKHHWPHVPVLGDIYDVKGRDLPEPHPDVIVGGFPCQPYSQAGQQRAQSDPRDLWPEMFRLVRECRPTWVVGENVVGLIQLGLDRVLSDLESEGYATRTFNIPACAVGAPHLRQRLWIVAHSHSPSEPDVPINEDAGRRQLGFDFVADTQREGERWGRLSRPRKDSRSNGEGSSVQSGGHSETVADTEEQGSQRHRKFNSERHRSGEQLTGEGGETLQDNWLTEPNVGRVAHGVPARVAQLRALGNALVPQIATQIGMAIGRVHQ